MKNLNKTNNATSNNRTRKDNNEENWEFEWLGNDSKKYKKNRQAKKPKTPSFMYNENLSDYEYDDFDDGYDDDYNSDVNYDSFNEEDESLFNTTKYFKCSYCSKIMDNEDSLLKHELVCKRLSHNFAKTSSSSSSGTHFNYTNDAPSSSSMTKCPICKCKMSTHEYLMHNCLMQNGHGDLNDNNNNDSKLHSNSFLSKDNSKTKKPSSNKNTKANSNSNNETAEKKTSAKNTNFTGLKREKIKSGIHIK